MGYRKYTQHYGALSATVLAIAGGNILAWTTGMLPVLTDKQNYPLDHPLDGVEAGLVTSLLLFGVTFGNLFVGLSLNYLGRKTTLLLCSVPLCLGWLAIYFIKTVEPLYAIRFITGFFGAFPIAAITVYLTEIVLPEHRGQLVILTMVMLEFGQLMVTAASGYMSYENTSLLCMCMPIIFFLVFFWSPESPYHYLRKGNTYKASKSLRRLRAGSISEELDKLTIDVQEDMKNKTTIKDLVTSNEYKRELIFVLGLKSLHQLSGNSAIQNYMGIIFKQASTGFDATLSVIVCTAVTVPAMFISYFCIDRFGRKPLYYVSTIGCTVSHLLEFTYFFLQDTLKYNMDDFAWLPLSGIFLFYIFRSFGVTTLAPLYMGELFPTNVKGAAVSVSMFYGSVLSFLVALLFPILTNAIGISFVFLIFAIICFLGFIFVLFVIPETKGKSLAEIHAEMKIRSTKL